MNSKTVFIVPARLKKTDNLCSARTVRDPKWMRALMSQCVSTCYVMHHALPRGIVVTRGITLCSAISCSLLYRVYEFGYISAANFGYGKIVAMN